MCPVHVKEMARKRNNPAQNLSFRKLATKNTQVVTTLIKIPKFDFQEKKKWLSLPNIYSKFILKSFVKNFWSKLTHYFAIWRPYF